MTIKNYLKNKLILFILHLLCMLGLTLYLNVLGMKILSISYILFVWIIILSIWLIYSYWKWKKRFIYLQSVMNHLEKKYLVTQVVTCGVELTEQFYFSLLRQAEKSMMEEVSEIRHSYVEYREYIEQWIHEVKGPLTSLKLKYENDKSGVLHQVMFETGQIENNVEQVLFFARSESIDKDFLVRKIAINDVINTAIIKNKHLLKNTMRVEVNEMRETVYSDNKWLEFIIGQVIINAVKYRNGADSFLKIYTETCCDKVLLKIEDNGMGILPSELPRIFDKGFTGTNGRNQKQSTGLGLYLCRRLCEKLGHEITVISTQNIGTTVTVGFLNT